MREGEEEREKVVGRWRRAIIREGGSGRGR